MKNISNITEEEAELITIWRSLPETIRQSLLGSIRADWKAWNKTKEGG